MLKSAILGFMMKNKIQTGHEIEVEVVDVGFLQGIMNKDYFGFTKLVDRMLRNVEILSGFPDEFTLSDYKGLFEKRGEESERLEFPVIGEYLNSIAGEEKIN